MRSISILAAAGLLAALASDALAADAPPAPAAPAPTEKPVVAPGSIKGLETTTMPPAVEYADAIACAPTPEERICTSGRCFSGIPEYVTPMFDPLGNFLIPWTGVRAPRSRPWTVWAAQTLTYDSNIYLAEDGDEEDDFISSTSVGFTVRHTSGDYMALASVGLTYNAYFDHSDENFLGGVGILEVGYFTGCGFYWGVSDRLTYTDDPIIVRDDQFIVINQERQEYWYNDLELRAGYHQTKWNAEAAYTLGMFFGDNNVYEYYDYLEHGLRARFDYYVTQKTSVGAYASVRLFDYTDDYWDDTWVYSAGATFSWRPLAKFGVQGSLGYAAARDGETDDSVVGDIQAVWDVTMMTSLAAGYSHQYEPGFGTEAIAVDSLFLRGHHNIAPCWLFSVNGGVQIGDAIDPTLNGTKDYTLWFFDAFVHRNIGTHWAVDLGYQYRLQDSDDGGIDYDDHRISIAVSWTL